MKNHTLILLILLTVASCKKKNKDESIERVKLYILVDVSVHSAGIPTSLQLSGTNIKTVDNVTSLNIIEVNYPKGETQTLTVKGIQGDPEMILEVSKGFSLNPAERVAYAIGKGTVTVTFVP